ncbi:unnamed protein product [Pedinophyceae sp. YPF-701]|nr:unnamed protein product [Pedinophyceae sp. YPF-701]
MLFYSFHFGPGVVMHYEGSGLAPLALVLLPWLLSTGVLEAVTRVFLTAIFGQAYTSHIAPPDPTPAAPPRTPPHMARHHRARAAEADVWGPSPVFLILNMLLPGLLSFLMFRYFLLRREHGSWGALQLLFDFRVGVPQSGTARHGPSHAERLRQVSFALSAMPEEEHRTPARLREMSVEELRARLREAGLNPAGAASSADGGAAGGELPSDKEELVQRLIDQGGTTGASCGICFDDYEDGDKLRRLPCSHKFHAHCIHRWAITSTQYSRPSSCPICNHPLCDAAAAAAAAAAAGQDGRAPGQEQRAGAEGGVTGPGGDVWGSASGLRRRQVHGEDAPPEEARVGSAGMPEPGGEQGAGGGPRQRPAPQQRPAHAHGDAAPEHLTPLGAALSSSTLGVVAALVALQVWNALL